MMSSSLNSVGLVTSLCGFLDALEPFIKMFISFPIDVPVRDGGYYRASSPGQHGRPFFPFNASC